MITPSWLPPASYSAYTIGDECCHRFGLWSRGSMNIAGCKWLSHRWSRIDTVDCDVEGKAEVWEGEGRDEGKYSKRMMKLEKGSTSPSFPPSSPVPLLLNGKSNEGKKKGRTMREYIVVQSRRRRTIGNEDRDSAGKDVGAIRDDSPFNS